MTMNPGQGSASILDSADPNFDTCQEGSALYRVQVGGRWTDLIGQAWFVNVTTGAAGEKFFGLAQQGPNRNNRLTALHEGIRRALPDLDEEGSPIAITLDDHVTHIGATNPGRVVVWTNAVGQEFDIGPCTRLIRSDDPTIFVRLGRD